MTETLRNGKRKAVLEALAQGNTRRAACAAAGISPWTFYDWLNEESPRFDHTLSHAVTCAEASAERVFVETVRQASEGYAVVRRVKTTFPDGKVQEVEEIDTHRDWRAAESWLKRRLPDEWGDRLDLRNLSDAQVIRLLERGLGPDDGSDPADTGSAVAGTDVSSPLAETGG